MNTDSIGCFLTFLLNYEKVKVTKNSKILFIVDSYHQDLVYGITKQLLQSLYNCTSCLIKSEDDLIMSDININSADIVLLFYRNAHVSVSTPVGNPLFAPLLPYIEQDIACQTGKFVECFDLVSIFDFLYTKQAGYYQNLNKLILQRINNGSLISLKGLHGSLVFDSDSTESWCSTDGLDTSLYPAEIASYSKSLNGEITFTGIILSRLPFTQKYGLINQDPILLIIENSEVKEFFTDNKLLKDDLSFYFNQSHYNRVVCEIGIGTNTGLKKLQPINAFSQERYPGLHLGFGGKSEDSMHLDMVFDTSEIHVDGSLLYKEHQFFIDL